MDSERLDIEEMREYLVGIADDAVLERRLDIVQAQIPLAYDQRKTAALERLQAHERLITERRLDLLLAEVQRDDERVSAHPLTGID